MLTFKQEGWWVLREIPSDFHSFRYNLTEYRAKLFKSFQYLESKLKFNTERREFFKIVWITCLFPFPSKPINVNRQPRKADRLLENSLKLFLKNIKKICFHKLIHSYISPLILTLLLDLQFPKESGCFILSKVPNKPMVIRFVNRT